MEKVIFILVLALSMCLGEQDAAVTPPVGSTAPPAAVTPPVGSTAPPGAVTPPVGSSAPPAAGVPTNPPAATSNPGPITTVAPPVTLPNDNATKPSSSTAAPITTPKSQSSNDNNTAHDTTTPKHNDTLPNGDKVPEKKDTDTSTKAPPSHNESVVVQTRAFDGPSFIGGIILTLGILAIGFMGFKYYRNQTERNYHTL